MSRRSLANGLTDTLRTYNIFDNEAIHQLCEELALPEANLHCGWYPTWTQCERRKKPDFWSARGSIDLLRTALDDIHKASHVRQDLRKNQKPEDLDESLNAWRILHNSLSTMDLSIQKTDWHLWDTIREWLDERITAGLAGDWIPMKTKDQVVKQLERCWSREDEVGRRTTPKATQVTLSVHPEGDSDTTTTEASVCVSFDIKTHDVTSDDPRSFLARETHVVSVSDLSGFIVLYPEVKDSVVVALENQLGLSDCLQVSPLM